MTYTPYWLIRLKHWLFHRHLWYYVDSLGVQFSYSGDYVWWTWPWKRKGRPKYLSLYFEGRFSSLKELKNQWERFYDACDEVNSRDLQDTDNL